MEFVQVRVLPNVSDPFPKKIVHERLDGAIRLLRGEIAVISTGHPTFIGCDCGI